MKVVRIAVALVIGVPLAIALLALWLPFAALECAARLIKNTISAIDNISSNILINPITKSKK